MADVRSWDEPFTFQLRDVFVIEAVGGRDHLLVESLVTGLVAANQKDRRAGWIERVEDADRLATALHAQLPHMAVLRPFDAGRVGERQIRSALHQNLGNGADVLLLRVAQCGPPHPELVGVLDVPAHAIYSLYGISSIDHSMRGIGTWSVHRRRDWGHLKVQRRGDVPAATLSGATIQNFDHAALDGRDRR